MDNYNYWERKPRSYARGVALADIIGAVLQVFLFGYVMLKVAGLLSPTPKATFYCEPKFWLAMVMEATQIIQLYVAMMLLTATVLETECSVAKRNTETWLYVTSVSFVVQFIIVFGGILVYGVIIQLILPPVIFLGRFVIVGHVSFFVKELEKKMSQPKAPKKVRVSGR